jgi:hypothetical protein
MIGAALKNYKKIKIIDTLSIWRLYLLKHSIHPMIWINIIISLKSRY